MPKTKSLLKQKFVFVERVSGDGMKVYHTHCKEGYLGIVCHEAPWFDYWICDPPSYTKSIESFHAFVVTKEEAAEEMWQRLFGSMLTTED